MNIRAELHLAQPARDRTMGVRGRMSRGLIVATALALTAFSADVRAASFDTLYSAPAENRGWLPLGSMVQDAKGAIYGVTNRGGAGCMGGCGVIYQLKPTASGPWKQKLLHKFSFAKGAQPNDGLIMGPDGTLYGTASFGGSLKGGTAFALTPPAAGESNWTYETMHEFDGASTNDHTPFGKLMLGNDGALYGMNGANAGDSGTIFRIKRTKTGWAYRALYHFTERLDPQWGLVQDAKGRLYGTGRSGGANDLGVVFRLSPPAEAGGDWTYKVLHHFSDDPAGAVNPQGTLVLRHGALYGQAFSPDAYDTIVFRLSLPSSFEVIYRMDKATQGSGAGTGLAIDGQGVIYGVNESDGPGGTGTLFKLLPPTSGGWRFRLLHAFGDTPDGNDPFCSPLLGEDGSVYVNTEVGGGDENNGGVFAYRP